jgi:hypothetical protein
MRRSLINWWVWTARPFLLNPWRTIRDWLSRPEPLTADELASLTPEEREALK